MLDLECQVRGMHDEGVCMAGGMHGKDGMCGRGHAWQERWPLQQAVCILLECILVTLYVNCENYFVII